MADSLLLRFKEILDPLDLEEAINVSQKAVSIEAYSKVGAYNALGSSYAYKYRLSSNVKDLDDSIQAYQQALRYVAPNSELVVRIQVNLAEELYERYCKLNSQSDLDNSLKVLELALSELNQAFVLSTVSYQIGQQITNYEIYKIAIEYYLTASMVWPNQYNYWLSESMVLAETSKSRMLSFALDNTTLLAPTSIPEDLLQKENNVLSSLIDLDAIALANYHSGSTESSEFHQQRRLEIQDELKSIWMKMTEYGTDATSYVNFRQGEKIEWQSIKNISAKLPDTALISFYHTRTSPMLFVLLPGNDIPISVEIDHSVWSALSSGMLREIPRQRSETWKKRWQDELVPSLLHTIPQFSTVKKIVIAPEASEHLIPWGVLIDHAGWEAKVSIIPSLTVLANILRRPIIKRRGSLIVGDPTGDLPYAIQEAQAVAKVLGEHPLIGASATKDAVISRLGQVEIAHFAAHAYFEEGSPLDSGVILAKGEVLTAREILASRSMSPNFVVLSACQSGMNKPLGGDEITGLSQSFIYAGARSLIASLWSVEDSSTAYLMSNFYTEWYKNGSDKPSALRYAMLKTRTQDRWKHTYYWGAFTLIGEPS